jgi:putative CocE/NonD family hydrolase
MYSYGLESPAMKFFAHHLKGENDGYADEPPVRIFVMGASTWRDEREWPLARTRWTSYFLHSAGSANSLDGDGALSTEPSAQEPADSFVYDPADPVPGSFTVGRSAGPETDPGSTGKRPDILVYTTAPLEEDVEVTGPVSVELWASSSAADTDFTAKLIDVFPDGEAIPLCQGIVRTGRAVPQPAAPGAVYRYDIDLWATSNLFRAGHRIRLHVTSSEFPTYELNPNTGARITHDPEGRTVAATQRVYHDPTHPSRLVLPVIPGAM